MMPRPKSSRPWLAWLNPLAAKRRATERPDFHRRPRLEHLEERWVPANVTLEVSPTQFDEAGGTSLVTAVLDQTEGTDVIVTLAFSGTAAFGTDYTASGTVITITAGETSASVTLTAIDDDLDEPDESVVVSITEVSGTNTISSPSTVTAFILDDDPTPTVNLAIDATTLAESGGQAVVTASLNTVSGQDVTVTLGFAGTATFGTDYTASGTTLLIPAGATSASITLTALDDTLDEFDESVVVSVSSLANATAGATTSVSASILDDDPTPTVSLAIDTTTLAESGGQALVTATLNTVSGQDVTVTLGFTGTAAFNEDYTASGLAIVIPAGSTSGSITLTAVDDALDELDETAVVRIARLENALTGATRQVTATILDDDPSPTVTLAINTTTLAEAGGQAVITATLATESGRDVTVTLAFSGTAALGADYTASGTAIVIPAGSTSASVTLTAIDDAFDEPDETVVVGVAGLAGAVTGGTTQLSATIVDDDVAVPPTDLFAAAQRAGDSGAETRVKVYNADGSLRFDFIPYGGWTGAVDVATADVNGDTVDDIITGAGPGAGPHVKVFDGATGAEIRSFFAFDQSFTGGVRVDGGDTNGDLRAEIFVGMGASPGEDSRVRVFDGLTNDVLQDFVPFGNYQGGVDVGAGDINSDNRADVIVGTNGGTQAHLKVFDGTTNALIRSYFVFPGYLGPISVDGGRVNGDATADILVGMGPSPGQDSRVLVIDGQSLDGAALLANFVPFPGFEGGVSVAASDADGDQLADIVVGAGPSAGPHVKVFAGLTLTELESFFAFNQTFTGGLFVG